jgi:hypothetical protein
VVNVADDVAYVTRAGVIRFPSSLPAAEFSSESTVSIRSSWGWPNATLFLSSVRSVISFAYPGKFEYGETWDPYQPYTVCKMTSVELPACDDELKAAVRALAAKMHAISSLAELAHDCVVANDLAAALEGLDLAPL